jgi:hypothetical protein
MCAAPWVVLFSHTQSVVAAARAGDRAPALHAVAGAGSRSYNGGVAFFSRSITYESNILPAWGAPGAASSEAQF